LTSQSIIPPYRGAFGAPRPASLRGLALPPAPMPARDGLRPLKAWRYVGVFGPELMLCVARVRIGPATQTFWMLWDRAGVRLREHTGLGGGSVRLEPGLVSIAGAGVEVELRLEETPGIEAVCPAGVSYAWTRKQGGVAARGTVRIDGVALGLDARAVIDDTAAYYPRHTTWRWSAGAGLAPDGREVAWNLVSGVNDPPRSSERTVWVGGVPVEVGPCRFAEDLTWVDGLRFRAEASRERRENLLLVRSRYRQPFGTFTGELPDGTALAEGYGVMEYHDAHW
jgi:Domain of unknown function (DUF2804), C-terminal